MVNPVLPVLLVALVAAAPTINLRVQNKDPLSCLKNDRSILLIAQKYGGDDPHGPDPHGDDPHDEYHDKNMPAYKEQKAHKAPKDVYGGEVPNDKEPY